MRNIKLILEYEGTNYHGWQSQAGTGRPTIQDTLEAALKKLTGSAHKTHASGRTDAGVHALGHVANFPTSATIPAEAWAPALNGLLPVDIRIVSSDEVSEGFHSRYSASGKLYLYRILNGPAPSALFRNFAWHVDRRLNVNRMKQAAATLLGKHDFSAFRDSGCTARTTVTSIRSLLIKRTGGLIDLWVEGDAFLKHMVRNIAGTLVEAGLGRFSAEDVAAMLRSCDRTKSGRTAPPQGLYLVRVFYEKNNAV